MNNNGISRRGLLAAGSAAIGASLASRLSAQPTPPPIPSAAGGFKFSLNASTISGQKLALPQQLETAAKAGYDVFEPWLRDIETYIRGGGKLADLRKQITDLGLTIENAIGFAAWVTDDDAARAKGLEQFKHDMDLVSQIGGRRIAAPPVGATDNANLDLMKAAERYRALCDIGQTFGVAPQIEIWGHSKALSKLSQALFVAAESGHRLACVLADVYHMYKGGSDFNGFRIAGRGAIQVLHMNDYPATPPRAQIGDQNRVYPGDGIAPLAQVLRDVRMNNPQCILSLELFNRDYWKQDALEVAKTGLAKMKAAVDKSA
jgi:2-keto-myo-inositol isomerase